MSDRTCSFQPCEKLIHSSGIDLCQGHYLQRKKGQELRPLIPYGQDSLLIRFENHIDYRGPVNKKTGTRCHIWTGSKHKKGYGEFKIAPSVKRKAHNKSCVNVEHLQPTLTNQRRTTRNKSGEWAISWDTRGGFWRVAIMVAGRQYSPALIGLPYSFRGDPPPAAPPQDAIDAREKLRVHLGLPE